MMNIRTPSRDAGLFFIWSGLHFILVFAKWGSCLRRHSEQIRRRRSQRPPLNLLRMWSNHAKGNQLSVVNSSSSTYVAGLDKQIKSWRAKPSQRMLGNKPLGTIFGCPRFLGYRDQSAIFILHWTISIRPLHYHSSGAQGTVRTKSQVKFPGTWAFHHRKSG